MTGNFMRNLSTKFKHKKTDSQESSPVRGPGRASTDHHANGNARHSSAVERANQNAEHTAKPNRVMSVGHEIAAKLNLKDTESNSTVSEKHRDSSETSKTLSRKDEKMSEDLRRQQRQSKANEDVFKKRREEMEKQRLEDDPETQKRYGYLPVNHYAGEFKHEQRVDLLKMSKDDIGKQVFFRGRVHNIRRMSAKLVFFLLRQQTTTIQGLLQASDKISENMVRWAEHLPLETIVLIRGTTQQPKAKEGEVVGAFIHDQEVVIEEIHVVSQLTEHLPYTVMEAEVTEVEAETSTRHHINQKTRLEGRILDLRTTASQAIFRIQAGVSGLFRSYLDSQGFMEIHSPKLQGGATESGASVFKVDYFGRTAFLAQSPQLAKQMSVAADFGKVYEVGAVFRAENSNTHRHLTEYTGLDIEMAIDEHYWEARNLIDRTLKFIFEGVYKRYPNEIAVIKKQFPHEDLVWLDQTPIIPFKEAIEMLNATGWTDEDGNPLPLDEDLGTRDEIQLGRVIKEKYKTDYYIIDKFPASARPFYTMPDPNDPTYTNSFDIFVRGQEITTGGERIHDANMLIAQMEKAKVDPKVMQEYMQGFEWAAPPHAGAGIGLERIMMLLLQLGDIRNASMYPRDPKSLPAKPKKKELRHPEASTLHPPWSGMSHQKIPEFEYQPLEKLIANYGDASNTSWLETRMQIWRDPETGAAVGYTPHEGFAITVGDPLCHHSQYLKTVTGFLGHAKKEGLKPLWLLCGADVAEELSSENLKWRTFSCAAEQRLDLTKPLKAQSDPEVQRKIRHATKEGVKLHDITIGTKPSDDFVNKCEKRIDDWLHARKDHQHVHLTEVHPWQDMEHRQYHYATDKEGTIVALVVLAQLSPEHGWQVKFSLDFPNSPSGSIEAIVMHSLTTIKNSGAPSCTFGGGATTTFTPGANLKGTKVKMLSRAYHTIATELKLTQKSEFREKLGAEDDPIFVCYPPKGLGPKGVHAILSFFED